MYFCRLYVRFRLDYYFYDYAKSTFASRLLSDFTILRLCCETTVLLYNDTAVLPYIVLREYCHHSHLRED